MTVDPAPVAALDPDRWMQAQRLFEQLAGTDPAGHAHALRQHLPAEGDGALRAMVAAMLAADAEAAVTGDQSWRSRLLRESLGMGDWEPGTRIGPWQVEALVGRGGMGEVYRASRADGTVQQTVALKRLSCARGLPEFERRFLAERRIIARLKHPYIARFLDAGADEQGRPYVAMEFVEGAVPLTWYGWTGPGGSRPLDVRQRVELLLRVADAVMHAHAQLVVHRDLKPGNVLVDAAGEPRLLDFGIAKALAGNEEVSGGCAPAPLETELGQQIFSLGYAAPEQLRGGPVGVQCDVYGLGGLLYELLTGRMPLELQGLAYGEAERRVLEQWPKAPSENLDPARIVGRPREWRKALRGDLDNIVLHALEKDPARRYGSVAALNEDLRRFLERQPISLRRDHRWYRFGRFVRRQWLPLALTGGIVLALAVGAVLLFEQSRVLQRERDAARSVTRLLTTAFQAADPSRHEGRQLLARDVLAVAAAELEHSADVDPVSRLMLGTTVAEVQHSIGEQDASLSLMLRLTVEAGTDLPPLERARAWRARAEIELGRIDPVAAGQSLAQASQALAAAAPDLERQREQFRQDFARARLLRANQQPAAELQAWQRLYQATGAALPPSDPQVLDAGKAYAQRLLLEAGRQDEALQLAERLAAGVPDLDRSVRGLELLGLLAGAARLAQQDRAAVQYAERRLAATRLLFGEGHRQMDAAYDLLARAQAQAGDLDAAEQNFARAIELLQTRSGRASQERLMAALNNRADFLRERRQHLLHAERDSRAALALAQSLYPSDHNNVAMMSTTLAEILVDQQRHAEALPLLAAADLNLVRLEREAGRELRVRAALRLLMARAQLGLGQHAQATGLLQLAWRRLRQEAEDYPARIEVEALARSAGIPLDPMPTAPAALP